MVNNIDEAMKICDEDFTLKSQDTTNIYDIKGKLIAIDDTKDMTLKNLDLIQKSIVGDKKAFDELYLQSYRYVFFVVRQYIADDETTYDAIQETFIKVYKNISNLSNPNAYYGWISSIAKNTAIDILRTTKFETKLSYEESDDTAFAEKEKEKDVSLDIETVLKKLDPQDADLLSLVYYDGMRVTQIAKMQCVPATTVYSRLNKAKKNLKAQLAVHGIDRSVYSGNFVAMITTAIRNIIGTAILSFSVAQQILNSVIGKKSKKELAIEKIILSHQKKLALKIASCLVAVCMIASCFTVLAVTDWGRAIVRDVKQTVKKTVQTITEHSYNESQSNKNDSLVGAVGGSTTENSTGKENDVLSGDFWQNLFGSGDEVENILNSQKPSESDETSSENNTHQSENSTSNTTTSDVSSVQSGGSDVSQGKTFILPNFTAPTVPSTFVPDCDPSQYNKVGNLYHNTTLHFGKVARQGDWIYYAAQDEDEWLLTNLYKVKTDGTPKQVLVYNVLITPHINVVGEWIYFIGGHALSDYYLARVRTDGTGYQQLTDFKIDGLQVFGDMAYFCTNRMNEKEPINYYKTDLKTGETTLLAEDINDRFACMTDKYFLYRPDGADTDLCVYDNKTGELIHNFKASGMLIYKNKVLVNEKGGLAIYDLDNLNKKPIKFDENIMLDGMKYLFYSPYNNGVLGGSIKIDDGQSSMGILTLANFNFVSWPFDWEHDSLDSFMNYSSFDDGYIYHVIDEKLYRSRPDGSECTIY